MSKIKKLKWPSNFILSVSDIKVSNTKVFSFSMTQLIEVSLLIQVFFLLFLPLSVEEMLRFDHWCRMNRVSFPLWSKKRSLCSAKRGHNQSASHTPQSSTLFVRSPVAFHTERLSSLAVWKACAQGFKKLTFLRAESAYSQHKKIKTASMSCTSHSYVGSLRYDFK